MDRNKNATNAAPFWAVLIDILMINIGMLVAYLLRYHFQWFVDVVFAASLLDYWPFHLLFTLLIPLWLLADGDYREWRGRNWLDHVYYIVNVMAKVLVLILALAFIFRPLIYSRLLLLEAGIAITVLLALGRASAMLILHRLRLQGKGLKRVVIVGAGEVGRRVMRTIVARSDLGYKIIGYVDDNPTKGAGEIGRIKGLGAIDALGASIEDLPVDEVIITLPWTQHRRILSVLRACESRGIATRIVPDFFQLSLSRVETSDLGGVPLISVRKIAFSSLALFSKRALDIFGALIGLTLGAPLFALIAYAIKRDSKGPVFFRQKRVGKGENPFKIYKFRSMQAGAEAKLEHLDELNEADGPLFKIRDDPRITRVGAFLRRTSLDELPQLFNVLKGEMSLVGPRPPTPEEVESYQQWHKKRLMVSPGMTGLWQVSGRSDLTFDEMVLLDIYYIENWSPWLDINILLRTVPKVILGEGAY